MVKFRLRDAWMGRCFKARKSCPAPVPPSSRRPHFLSGEFLPPAMRSKGLSPTRDPLAQEWQEVDAEPQFGQQDDGWRPFIVEAAAC